MGRVPGRVLLAGRPDEDEEELEEIVLWARRMRGPGAAGSVRRWRMGRAHPSRMYFSFVPFIRHFPLSHHYGEVMG